LTAPHRLLWKGIFGLDAEAVSGEAPGGVVLFGRNLDPDPVAGPARCSALIADLQARWGGEAPLAVALDQEGGAVSRLKIWVGPTPSLRRIWSAGGPEACARWGALWGRGLALLGFNVAFAPVADLWQAGSALGNRCASPEPLQAARGAGAFLTGLEGEGVRGCLKHFPGLGGTTLDSHLGLPELRDPLVLQRNREPFLALAHPDRLVMVAHLLLPHTQGLPASLSPAAVAGNPWGVTARWLPDDLEMGGCQDWPWADRVRLCLEAGHQALLVCQTPEGVAACAQAAQALPESLWRPAELQFFNLRRRLRPGAVFRADAWRQWLQDVQGETAGLEGCFPAQPRYS
jgi:beta-N-acetylhexosaminidase